MKKISLVILAAGKGTRFAPLTQTTPKPLIKVCGKPAIEYTIESALPYISEIILVIGYLGDKFKEYFGNSYHGVPIKYVENDQQLGTATSFFSSQSYVENDQILLVYGDDFYDSKTIKKVITKKRAIAGQVEKNWQNFGVLKVKKDQSLDRIIEKPTHFVGDLVNIGVYLLDRHAYSYFDKVQNSARGEMEFTDLISYYAKDFPVEVVRIEEGWIPLSYPWQLFALNKFLVNESDMGIKGSIEDGVTIKGKLILGKGSVVKKGTYIEGDFYIGENCVIGPNCHLKGFGSIGNNSIIGAGVELDQVIMGDNVKIGQLSYICDSIFGNNIKIGAETIIKNLHHSQKNIQMKIAGKLVDTGSSRMGAILGDKVRLGIKTSIYPGVTVNYNSRTLPGTTIRSNL